MSLIHHIQLFVGNAIQASFWYCTVFGFKRIAQRRTATTLSIVIKNGNALIVLTSPNSPSESLATNLLASHGDFVRKVGLQVDDVQKFLEIAKDSIVITKELDTVTDDYGSVKTIGIQGSVANIEYELFQNVDYHGSFLPGYDVVADIGFCSTLPPIPISHIDHFVEAHPSGTVDTVVDWYNKVLQFERFWSIDDKQVHTEYSALKAALVANPERNVQVTVVEPVQTEKKGRGQVQEFLDFNSGPGIQHVAFAVDDIISTVSEMRRRSVEFLSIPSEYYDNIEKRLATTGLKIEEDMVKIRENQLLVDFDDKGYLIQCFTKPVQPLPTFFVEIIRRNNFDGFGAGNFKALFEAVEIEQRKRGTLIQE
ncbi:unnamed protein product [Bursaphelenchus okinawaensis]|uniref:4-hydroxyphenylpyruvate dioxygenase n=1 Tax=Bursaphelenchus okinawaensis TaxID=465554 RepID=A0A811LR96_9BILA|nr:unnamed protein product [Bursaphelenchus okinawaensis]CAG9127154.1 unnamed protein product [Bursaphelenchus okinawaensis]